MKDTPNPIAIRCLSFSRQVLMKRYLIVCDRILHSQCTAVRKWTTNPVPGVHSCQQMDHKPRPGGSFPVFKDFRRYDPLYLSCQDAADDQVHKSNSSKYPGIHKPVKLKIHSHSGIGNEIRIY